jgi:hypothetical protein
MPEAAMQQDHGRAGPIRCVPNLRTVVFDVAVIMGDRQRRGTIGFKLAEIVVVRFQGTLAHPTSVLLRFSCNDTTSMRQIRSQQMWETMRWRSRTIM